MKVVRGLRGAALAAPRRLASPAAGALLAVALLAGCAGPAVRPATLPERVELAQVPFHPQREYECGPASLAMVLNAAGVPVSPDALVPQVYLPARRGSLQVEMAAATRRNGRIAYVLPPSADALWVELAAGRPVVVLQNFGSRAAPQWHYAVAIGYEDGHVLLRSGTTERERLRDARFLGTWERGDRWSMVALRPGELPAAAEPRRYLEAASAFEAQAAPADAVAAYASATDRWPDEPAAWLGLGNARARANDAAGAEAAYRAALAVAPQHAAARNNLAELLARRGCVATARTEIERAVADAAGTPLEAAVEKTRAELAALPAGAEPAGCPAR